MLSIVISFPHRAIKYDIEEFPSSEMSNEMTIQEDCVGAKISPDISDLVDVTGKG